MANKKSLKISMQWGMQCLHLLSVIYSHHLSILIFTAGLIIALTTFTHHTIVTSPWKDQGRLQDSVSSGLQMSDYVLDHFIVALALMPPLFWIFVLTIAYSSAKNSLDWILLILRVTSCACVAISLTVMITEHFSRRSILAMLVFIYGTTGMLYSWSFLHWKWYIQTFSKKGLIGYLPDSLQHLLLRCSLIEWLSDRTLFESMKAFVPFVLPLTEIEQNIVLRQLPKSTQRIMCRPGMIKFFPTQLQRALLPDSDKKACVTNDSHGQPKISEMQLNAQVYPTIRSKMQVGFDFHKPSALKLLNPKSTPSRKMEDAIYRILIARLSRSPFACIPFGRNQSLTRIATVSGTLLMLQMYLSPKSRQLIKSSLQLTSAMTLGLAVIFAAGLQSVPKCKSFLCHLSSHLWSFSHRPGHYLQSHEHGASAELPWKKKFTSSVSLVLVIIFMAKRWKNI